MPPTAAMRGHDTLDMRVRFKPAALVVAVVILLAVAYALAQLPPIGRRPVFGYMSSFAIVIGAAFLVPAIMYGLARLGRRDAAARGWASRACSRTPT